LSLKAPPLAAGIFYLEEMAGCLVVVTPQGIRIRRHPYAGWSHLHPLHRPRSVR